MDLREETRFIMNKYGISANKRLGQNFLIDDYAVSSIVEAADISKEDYVIEIGPGLGTLTSKLLEKAGKVTCIELDDRMLTILKDRFSLYDNFELIHGDVVKFPLSPKIYDTLNSSSTLKNVKVVANLPYYITTPIIMKLLNERLNLKSITVMIQKEVAERLVANPGEKECGAITYAIYYYSNPQICLEVLRDSFIPAPEVDSAVIRLDILDKPRLTIEDEKYFFDIIKASFMQKRKTLVNALVNGKIIPTKQMAEEMLISLGFDTNIRGEKLTLEDFKKIYDYLKKIK